MIYIIFFGFNMVFTPGLWWSVIPIGIYALIIVGTHAPKIHTLWEEKAIQIEIKKLRQQNGQKLLEDPENENLPSGSKSVLSRSTWDENEIV